MQEFFPKSFISPSTNHAVHACWKSVCKTKIKMLQNLQMMKFKHVGMGKGVIMRHLMMLMEVVLQLILLVYICYMLYHEVNSFSLRPKGLKLSMSVMKIWQRANYSHGHLLAVKFCKRFACETTNENCLLKCLHLMVA
jgi:hypothetical protein